MNAAEMLPYYVSWGGEVNAAHFHNNMVKQWNKDNTIFNELFYKELIGKKIMFAYIEHVISDQQWYQERRAYRPQIVAYSFSKLVYEAQRAKRESIIGKFGTIRKFPIFLKPMLPVLGNWYSIRYMTKIGRQPTLKPIARRKSVGR